MPVQIIKTPITRQALQRAADEFGYEAAKAVVDVEQRIMAIGGEMHADEETALLDQCGSKREHTWGINVKPDADRKEWVEFDSMINLKPAYGNRSRSVEDPALQETIKEIVGELVAD